MARSRKLDYRPDEIDWQIVDALKNHGRRSNTEIAAHLRLNETTVRKRIARLLAGRFMSVVAVPNPLRMGYSVVALIGVTAAANQLERVEAALQKLDALRYIALTTGSFDFILEAWFVSNDALRDFLVRDLGKVAGVVRMETFHVLKLIRHLSDWGLPDRIPQSMAKSRSKQRMSSASLVPPPGQAQDVQNGRRPLGPRQTNTPNALRLSRHPRYESATLPLQPPQSLPKNRAVQDS